MEEVGQLRVRCCPWQGRGCVEDSKPVIDQVFSSRFRSSPLATVSNVEVESQRRNTWHQSVRHVAARAIHLLRVARFDGHSGVWGKTPLHGGIDEPTRGWILRRPCPAMCRRVDHTGINESHGSRRHAATHASSRKQAHCHHSRRSTRSPSANEHGDRLPCIAHWTCCRSYGLFLRSVLENHGHLDESNHS